MIYTKVLTLENGSMKSLGHGLKYISTISYWVLRSLIISADNGAAYMPNLILTVDMDDTDTKENWPTNTDTEMSNHGSGLMRTQFRIFFIF